MIEDRPVQPNELRAQATRSVLQRLFRDLAALSTLEIQFVKTEVTEKVKVASAALPTLGLGIACLAVALGCFAACLIALLGPAIGVWVAALVLAIAFGALGAVLATSARTALLGGGGVALTKTAAHFPALTRSTHASLAEQQDRIDDLRARVDESLRVLERKNDLLGPMRDTAYGVGSLSVAVAAILRSGEHANAR